MMSKHPMFIWAQCSDNVYLTISLPDARGFSVDCEPEGVFKLSAVDVNNESCNFILQLYGNISPQGCETKIGSKDIMCCIPKEQKGWWKRLLKFYAKDAQFIEIDWNKWCDDEGENLELENLASDDDIMDDPDFETDDDDDNDNDNCWTRTQNFLAWTPSITKRMKIDGYVFYSSTRLSSSPCTAPPDKISGSSPSPCLKVQNQEHLGLQNPSCGHQIIKSPNMRKHPKFLWAQTFDNVYLTVSLPLPDAIRFSVDCEPEGVFKFSAVDVNNESCNFILQHYGNISPQGCETKIGSRGIMCCIPKEQKGWWKRLLKFKMKAFPYINNKIDWNRWCDEEGENLRSKKYGFS